ncbi:MAG: M1 family peptidase [Betaproteobacteria bacterium]|nr:MAG: M1 family peptidase [Betaproteobacteria bacterium]
MRAWLGAAAAAISVHAAAAPDVALDLRLDPATREFSAVAELWRPPRNYQFTPHPSLTVRRVEKERSGLMRIEYGGTLPALDRNIDFRGVLQALPPMASPEGSYLGAASGWYPQPHKLFTYRVHLRVSGKQKALVPGKLISENTQDDSYEATFDYEAPADGIDLMAGPYEVREKFTQLEDGRRVRLRTYFFADLAPLAEAYLDDSARYIERYSKAIGPYPFFEFSVVASPLPSGFGMPTLTYIGAQVLQLPFIRATSLGHEVLHNWWGNGVLVDYARGNWSEGLTTFMADYAYKEAESPQAARDARLQWLRDLAAVPASAQRPLLEFRSRTHGADAVVGYGKSAMLFFMLRDLIGEEAFATGIRRFWVENSFRLASWDELLDAFELASGRDLLGFSEQWLTRAGAPAVRISSARAVGKEVQLNLTQSTPAYALRLPVEFVFDNRSETRWVEIDREKQTVNVQLTETPREVRLDPELRVWRFLERDELPPILRQWILAKSPALMRVSAVGQSLAGRFFESPFHEVKRPDGEPLLIIGLHADVDAALRRLKLPPRPPQVAGKGTAQVWTIKGSNVAVISANDERSLEALARPLPHYGSQSWLAFDGARVIERGAWPPLVRSIPVK